MIELIEYVPITSSLSSNVYSSVPIECPLPPPEAFTEVAEVTDSSLTANSLPFQVAFWVTTFRGLFADILTVTPDPKFAVPDFVTTALFSILIEEPSA